jgi:hypothetical protein
MTFISPSLIPLFSSNLMFIGDFPTANAEIMWEISRPSAAGQQLWRNYKTVKEWKRDGEKKDPAGIRVLKKKIYFFQNGLSSLHIGPFSG